MKKLLALLSVGCFALSPLAGAADDLVVHLAPPSSPCYVNITNECDCPVRLFVVSSSGRRYFLAQLAPGDHFDRQMGPPLPARHWLVTSTSEETLARFNLDGSSECGHVVLRCGHGGAVTTTTTVRRRDYSK